MTSSITLTSDDLRLEALLNTKSRTKAVVITHPHPLHGGNMHNAVVDLIAGVYEDGGWTTLRFNFRGTGGSQGNFDEGVGEQRDLQAAIEYLRLQGYAGIDLAGYSFGAWVIARWTQANTGAGHRIFLVSPPVAFLDFDGIASIPGLEAVFVGSRDMFGPAEQIETCVPRWRSGAGLHLIEGADHFFSHHAQQLRRAIARAV